MTYETCLPGTFNTGALGDPIEALPNLDLLPLCSVGEQACQSYAVLDGHLSRAAGFVLIFHDHVLR